MALALGFGFGGLVGILDSGHPIAAVALLAALVLLHLRNCVRPPDGRRPAGWRWTLAAQAVLTAVGMIWFAGTWYGNSGFLAAAVLLLVRPPRLAWAGFGLVVAAQFVAALPVRPTVGEALYLAVGHAAFVGIALYAVARLADLVSDVRDTTLALAAAEVARERLAFGRELNERVGASLRDLVADGEAILARAEGARPRLDAALARARTALNEARSVAHGHRDDAGSAPRRAAADLGTGSVAALGIAAIVLMIAPTALRYAARADLSAGEWALLVAVLVTFVALYLWACLPPRPRWWLLPAAVALATAPLAVLDFQVWHVAYFLPGLSLVLLRGPVRWVVSVPLIGLDAVLYLWDANLGDPTVLGLIYEAVWSGERALLVLALASMAGLTARLVAARAELARAAVVHERLRFARDLHDLFGYSLSVLVLKSELAVRLLDRDAGRARAELAAGVEVARQALAELESVAVGYRAMTVEAESRTARAVLTDAGIEVTGEVASGPLHEEIDTVLSIVLREGVTNLLRHSTARRCRLTLERGPTQVCLSLVNDGAAGTSTGGRGMGLDNLARRVGAVGGRLSTVSEDDEFRLVVTVPLEPALVGGDADRVDAVAGVQPGDGRREVVAHRTHAQE
ncbi:sensor histidine kinase [Asanoa siamensis]|nr:histidine kinase [Asanoa siamensis]